MNFLGQGGDAAFVQRAGGRGEDARPNLDDDHVGGGGNFLT